MKKLSFLFVFIILSFLNAFSFSIDKPSMHITTERGGNQSFSITLKNNNDTPIVVKVYVQDWIYNENKKGKVFLNPGSVKNSCANWIKLDQNELKIEPSAKKEFNFRIETPRDAKGGNQAVIFFETSLDKEVKGLSYGARLGSIIYQETKDNTVKKLEIIDKSISRQGNKVNYRLKIKNSGDSWNSATAMLVLLKNSEVVAQEDTDLANLLPGDSVDFTGDLAGAGNEVLITIEDAGENLITERVILGRLAESKSSSATVYSSVIKIQSFIPVFLKTTKELKISAVLLSNQAKKVIPEAKVLKMVPGKNVYERLKTLSFGEQELLIGEEKQIEIIWQAGDSLPAGKYIVKLTVPDLEENVVSEKEIEI